MSSTETAAAILDRETRAENGHSLVGTVDSIMDKPLTQLRYYFTQLAVGAQEWRERAEDAQRRLDEDTQLLKAAKETIAALMASKEETERALDANEKIIDDCHVRLGRLDQRLTETQHLKNDLYEETKFYRNQVRQVRDFVVSFEPPLSVDEFRMRVRRIVEDADRADAVRTNPVQEKPVQSDRADYWEAQRQSRPGQGPETQLEAELSSGTDRPRGLGFEADASKNYVPPGLSRREYEPRPRRDVNDFTGFISPPRDYR